MHLRFVVVYLSLSFSTWCWLFPKPYGYINNVYTHFAILYFLDVFSQNCISKAECKKKKKYIYTYVHTVHVYIYVSEQKTIYLTRFMFIMSNWSEHVQKFTLVTPSLLRKSCAALTFSRENVYIENLFKAMQMTTYHSHALTLTDSSVPRSISSLSPQRDGRQKDKTEETHMLK